MALYTYTATEEWDAGARYTATGETEVLLQNNGSFTTAWTITDSDTLPSYAVEYAIQLEPGEKLGLTLKDGERLWLASRGRASERLVQVSRGEHLTVSVSVIDDVRVTGEAQGGGQTLTALASAIGQLSQRVSGGQIELRGGTLDDPALRIGTVGIYSAAADTLSVAIAGTEVRREIEAFLWAELALRTNAKTQVFPVGGPNGRALDFLGYRIWTTHRALRKDSIHRMKRKMRRMARLYHEGRMTWDEIDPVIMSWVGHARHADTYNLRSKVLGGVGFVPPPLHAERQRA